MSEKTAAQLIVAIDGPAGAGKSTVAALIAKRFGLLNLESGAMYRALALKAIEADLDFDNGEEMEGLASRTEIRLLPATVGNRVLLDGVDVTRRIREPDVTAAASRVSVHPAIREWMVAMQRNLGARGGIVMEGRDIGSVVFPQADVKIFLDATPQIRGQRRFAQNSARDEGAASILKEIQERDRRDRTRVQSPLKPANDALVIDSTDISLEEVVAQVEAAIRERLADC